MKALRDGLNGRVTALLTAAGTLLACAGCWTTPSGARLLPERYQPETQRPGDWYSSLHPDAQVARAEPPPPRTPAAPAARVSTVPAAPAAPAAPATPRASGAQPPAAQPPAMTAAQTAADNALRTFVRGDRVLIALLGVPVTDKDKIEDIVDDRGCVSLPHIGAVRFEGRSPADIEEEIERLYVVDKQIYKSINVSVISPDDEFFVRGEVRKEGRFPLTGGMTLSKAIAVASGFGEFADRKQVEIRRGEERIRCDMGKIDRGELPDPPVKRGDIIFVDRRWM